MDRHPIAEPESAVHRLLTMSIAREQDVVTARQRARQVARLIGFGIQDQIRIAASTSEITRNAVQYARSGFVEFSFEAASESSRLIVRVTDQGPGILDTDAVVDGCSNSRSGMGLGLIGTRRLMDFFSLDSTSGMGTTVTFGKFLPPGAGKPDAHKIARLIEQLGRGASPDSTAELQKSNRELIDALNTLRNQELELERRQAEVERLSQELEETNRGVVALYAELDDRATALRRADDVKSRFLSYMSHEFRTPLNSIAALTDLLIRRVDGDLTAEQEKQVKLVRVASEELFEMVNDLLDLAKIEAGKVDLRWGRIEVSRLFGVLRGMMRPLATRPAVSLIFDDPPDDLILYSDEGKLAQILRNLISNALKFTERGEVRISAVHRQTNVVFSVSDTGIGIAPEDQESIFQEFSQIEHPLQRKVKGTGLGLPLSRKLSELLGGNLTVTSIQEAGSTFRVTLPVSIRASAASRSEHDGASSRSGAEQDGSDQASPGSILIIDDEEVARYLVRQWFRGTGYVITEAADSIEGLERARFDQPRLIILDLAMPNRNGFEVLRDLKADPATADIPVVIHTSRALELADLAQLGGRHAAVLPKKPGTHDQAFAVIRELLGEPNLFTE